MMSLHWFPELDFGVYPVVASEEPYDQAYFDKYVQMAKTEQGQTITAKRVELVNQFHTGRIVDIGVGSGAFVDAHGMAFGFDINPVAVEYLKKHDKYVPFPGLLDEKQTRFEAISMWDVLEHLRYPGKYLRWASRFVFLSIPIFENAENAVRSRHFRKNEHRWYFTRSSLKAFMAEYGFRCVHEEHEPETGRESVFRFVFERTADG